MGGWVGGWVGEARKREEEKDLINVLGYGEGKVSNMAYYVKKIVPIKGGSPTLIKSVFFLTYQFTSCLLFVIPTNESQELKKI